MSDGFNREARAFVASYDELGLERKTAWELPEKDSTEWNLVRRMIGQAEWLSGQRNNPLVDLDIPQRMVINFADDFLKWAGDPSQPRWARLFGGCNAIRWVWECSERY
jgi:hypothetical protein